MEPYIISITTIPSRILLSRDVIESFLHQSLRSSLKKFIVINIPHKYDRFQEIIDPNTLPLGLQEHPNIVLNWIEKDYGPGTKMLGLKDYNVDPNTIVICTDDDTEKKFHWAEDIVMSVKYNSKSVCSFAPIHYNKILFGGAGFAFYKKLLSFDEVEVFFNNICDRVSGVKYIDDDYLTVFMLINDIHINYVYCNPIPYIAEKPHFINKLREMDGSNRRAHLQSLFKDFVQKEYRIYY